MVNLDNEAGDLMILFSSQAEHWKLLGPMQDLQE